WLYADWLQNDILENSKDNAVRIARHIHFQIQQKFVAKPFPPKNQSSDSTLQETNAKLGAIDDFDPGLIDLEGKPELGAFGDLNRDELKRLNIIVREAITQQDIVNVYVFDVRGHITYSTELADVGFDLKNNKYYDDALKGKINSVVVERGSPVDISKQRFGVVLLETYVPIYSAEGSIIGVIEIYQDASTMKKNVNRGMLHIGLASILGFTLLTVGLWFVVSGAQKHLETRTTALIHTNQELTALSASLEEQVQERGRQLSRAETLASVGTLAAGVAHEINNPIATIASCAEGLLRKQQREKEEPESRLIHYLNLIKDEAYRVKGITRNLLDFSRPSNSQMRVIDIREPLSATMSVLEFRAKKAGVQLDFQSPEQEIMMRGDPNALRQLFLNLTLNALDASESGTRVRWSLARDSDQSILVTCEDEGCGIDGKESDRILEPFFTTKEPGQGTGLGLSISHTIVETHKGTMLIKNGPEKGVKVTLRFPSVHSKRAPESDEGALES
ncbi:MAG: ATP-binding protein, partial [Planctomycetota bacterium]|nr:ATP-binding protein [Planctomycetota bacterium]